jgi:hypothetical protein
VGHRERGGAAVNRATAVAAGLRGAGGSALPVLQSHEGGPLPRSAESGRKLQDYGHVESERQCQAGHGFAGLDHPAQDRQIDRPQQESRRIVDESVLAEVHPLSPLGDCGQARLVSHRAWSGRGRPPHERQAGDVRYPFLRGAEQGNPASQRRPQLARWIRQPARLYCAVPHNQRSRFPVPGITAACVRGSTFQEE